MMAVSLPLGFLNNPDTSLESANEGIQTYGFEDFLHCISKESMDQIRKTILRHEELFKEQVQMLHCLYNTQKSAMQEIRKAIYSQARVLPFHCKTISDWNCKPLRPSYVAPQNHVESHIFSQDPYCAVKGFTSASTKTSIWMNDIDAKTLPRVQSKPRREIDLERPPEDYMDDIEAQDVANCYQALDSSTCLAEETKEQSRDLLVEKDLSNVKADCPSLECADKIILMGAYPEPTQGIYQNCGRSSEIKILETLACNSKTVNQNLYIATENCTKEFTCNHPLAAGPAPVYEESKPSHLCLLQGKLTFTAQRLQSTKNYLESEDVETSPEQVKGSDNLITPVRQSLQSNCLTTKSLSELDYEQKISVNGESLCSDAVIFPQSSSVHEQCDAHKLSNCSVKVFPSLQTNSTFRRQTSFLRTEAYQRSEDDGKKDRNYSNNGSNSIDFLGDKVQKDSGDSTFSFKSDSFGLDHGELAQMSQCEAGVQSEHEEATQLVNFGIKSFLPPSGQGFKADLVDHIQTKCSYGEPATVTKSHEETSEELFQEASESVAARILLSFVPDRSKSNTKERDCVKHMEAEPSRKNIDVAFHERKRSLRARRTINYYDGGVMDETMKWAKSFQGRRSLRRP